MKSPLGFWSWTNRLSKLEKVFDTVRICDSLFSLIFVSIAATALFIYIFRALFSKNFIAESKNWNKDARAWNLQKRCPGCPEPFSNPHPLALWAVFCELPCWCPLFIQRINFAQILSKPPFSVCNWMTYLDSGNDWATERNWTECLISISIFQHLRYVLSPINQQPCLWQCHFNVPKEGLVFYLLLLCLVLRELYS